MSYTKKAYENNIINNVKQINNKTINDNDITPLMNLIDNTFSIVEEINKKDSDIGELWNEIASDIIASINSSTSGFYRQGIITLRSVLELGCMSFFYSDHKVEFHLFKAHDAKADKYVSTLIRDYDFYTTNYIQSFYNNIQKIQTKNNSISIFLSKIYKDLSDVVHGRYKTLTKQNTLKINYSKEQFNFFNDKLHSVLSILAVMYILRYQDIDNTSLIALANKSGTVQL
ncbi:hypothetical protein [Bacillus safensis]|uniref:hypothetical protein n=2 Tax=Bacillus safensis TaxID=561879 RepID=UPI0009C126F7|nr:hypothetical protein [Bacillus safensis]ARD57032.1 hypothetical protein BRL64_12895 [Bacillus safensis]